MIYHLYLLVYLTNGQVQYDPVGPSGPDITTCVKYAQHAINQRVARGDVKHYTFQCLQRPVSK